MRGNSSPEVINTRREATQKWPAGGRRSKRQIDGRRESSPCRYALAHRQLRQHESRLPQGVQVLAVTRREVTAARNVH
jgi:hypothetical protein